MVKKQTQKMKNDRFAVALEVNDIHLNKDNGELVKDIFRQIISVCKKYSITNIIIGGDVFTNRSGQPLECLTTWSEIINMVQEAHRQIIVIPGNHDKTDGESDRSYLDVFRYHPCLRIIDSGRAIILNPDFVLGCIPYFPDEKWLDEFEGVEETIENQMLDHDLNPDAVKILITHMGIEGVKNNDGTEVISAIKPSNFKNWDKVIVGHYHNASKIGKNIYYTGSAYQNNHGENVVDKGFTIIYSNGDLEFIPSKFPKYIKEVIDVDDTESLRNILEKYEGEMYDNIRLIFRGKKVDAKKVNVIELSKLGFDVKFESTEETEMIESSEGDTVMSFDKKSIYKNFVKFCSENKIKGKKLQYGMKIMKEL